MMKKNNKEKVLITGVAGFIGSNLANRLIKEGYEVLGIDTLEYGIKEQIPRGVKFFKRDIRSTNIYPLFKDVDYVFHLAAKNCLMDCQRDPVETSDINITGTMNVFEAARRACVKKIVYAETAALYEGVDKFPSIENKIKPQGFYAISKLANHYFAKAYKKFFGLESVGLRYFNVYGPQQDYRRSIPPVMSAFIIKLLSAKAPIIYGDGEQKRDFIYVDDINDFHMLSIKTDQVNGRVFNLGSGKNYSVLEIYQIISNLLKVKIKPNFKEALDYENKISLADISEARKLGWAPKTIIEVGLKNMISYIRKEIRAGNINL